MRARREDLPDPVRVLSRRAPWDALTRAGLDRAVAALRPRSIGRGEVLIAHGDRSEGLHVVAGGSFKVGRVGPGGREQILYVARAGKSIAESLGALGGRDARSVVSVVALEPGSAWILPRLDLESLVTTEPVFARALVDMLARRVAGLVDLVEDLALRDVPGRLAAFLHAQAARGGATDGVPYRIERTLAVETVAGRLGTVREEVQRALRRLADERVIALSRREITVIDLAALARLAIEG